jgi:hypothetical protein
MGQCRRDLIEKRLRVEKTRSALARGITSRELNDPTESGKRGDVMGAVDDDMERMDVPRVRLVSENNGG